MSIIDFMKLDEPALLSAVLASFDRQRCVAAIHTVMLNAYEQKTNTMIDICRRAGKSTAIAMFASALLVARPGIRVQIISPDNRARDAIKDIVINAVCQHRARITRSTKQRLTIQVPDQDKSHLFLSHDATNDGCVADVTLVDEVQFHATQQMAATLDVLRSVGLTTVIGVSTSDALSNDIFGQPSML